MQTDPSHQGLPPSAYPPFFILLATAITFVLVFSTVTEAQADYKMERLIPSLNTLDGKTEVTEIIDLRWDAEERGYHLLARIQLNHSNHQRYVYQSPAKAIYLLNLVFPDDLKSDILQQATKVNAVGFNADGDIVGWATIEWKVKRRPRHRDVLKVEKRLIVFDLENSDHCLSNVEAIPECLNGQLLNTPFEGILRAVSRGSRSELLLYGVHEDHPSGFRLPPLFYRYDGKNYQIVETPRIFVPLGDPVEDIFSALDSEGFVIGSSRYYSVNRSFVSYNDRGHTGVIGRYDANDNYGFHSISFSGALNDEVFILNYRGKLDDIRISLESGCEECGGLQTTNIVRPARHFQSSSKPLFMMPARRYAEAEAFNMNSLGAVVGISYVPCLRCADHIAQKERPTQVAVLWKRDQNLPINLNELLSEGKIVNQTGYKKERPVAGIDPDYRVVDMDLIKATFVTSHNAIAAQLRLRLENKSGPECNCQLCQEHRNQKPIKVIHPPIERIDWVSLIPL